MTPTTATAFDPAVFSRATSERDSETLLSMFADDAEWSTVDKENPPSRPSVLRGRDAIAGKLRDIYGRDMTHEVADLVRSGDQVAYTVNCQYPDGSRVMCMSTLELRDGKIARQTGMQVWDE
jgi:ketosteroid isomerase-like protein